MNRGIAILAIAFIVAGCGSGSGTPAPAASATPVPLAAGTYTSEAFQPAVTFTVGTGWTKPVDVASYLNLQPVGNDLVGIHLFRNPVALSQATDCPAAAEPGVGTSTLELLTWIRARPGLAVSSPAMATIGGLPASSVDVSIKPDWTQSCSFAGGSPTVPLFFGPTSGLRWIVVGNERLRLYFVDQPSGGNVIVDIDAFDGTQLDALLAAAGPVIKSFTFAKG